MTSLAQDGSDLTGALTRLASRPDDDATRLAFHAALTAAEVCVWLSAEDGAGEGRLSPRVFALESGPTVLAFDSEGALAEFAGEPVPYAALPGRVLVPLLAAARPPLALLVQTAAGAAELMSPGAVAWLAGQLQAPSPEARQGRAIGFSAPDLQPEVLSALTAVLERRLSGVPGLELAVLAVAHWPDGAEGLVVALGGLPEVAQAPIARAVAEGVAISGLDLPGLDVIFPAPATLTAIAAAGLRLKPAPFVQLAERPPPAAPGSDPDRPPKLR